MNVVPLLLLLPLARGQAVVNLDSGYNTGSIGSSSCKWTSDGSVTSSTSLTLASAALVDLSDIHFDVWVAYETCPTYVEQADLVIDGIATWTQFIDTTYLTPTTVCSWYDEHVYDPPPQTGIPLSTGTHTIAVHVIGTVGDTCNQIKARLQATATVWTDADMDGQPLPDDCDDTDPTVYPGAHETWYDGTDQDCDGNDDDQDGDGYPASTDCDDEHATIHPGATETWYDGRDQDCDGNDADQDGDGVPSPSDCADQDPSIRPGVPETWYDGTDQDCDGNDDDRDRDGWPVTTDCDDTDASAWPGAPGWSEDCTRDTGDPPVDTADPPDTDTPPVDTGDSRPDQDTGGPRERRKTGYFVGGACGCGAPTGPMGGLTLLLAGLLLRVRRATRR